MFALNRCAVGDTGTVAPEIETTCMHASHDAVTDAIYSPCRRALRAPPLLASGDRVNRTKRDDWSQAAAAQSSLRL